jgi:hypothetical protein
MASRLRFFVLLSLLIKNFRILAPIALGGQLKLADREVRIKQIQLEQAYSILLRLVILLKLDASGHS